MQHINHLFFIWKVPRPFKWCITHHDDHPTYWSHISHEKRHHAWV